MEGFWSDSSIIWLRNCTVQLFTTQSHTLTAELLPAACRVPSHAQHHSHNKELQFPCTAVTHWLLQRDPVYIPWHKTRRFSIM